jgi:colicin import membrane protein
MNRLARSGHRRSVAALALGIAALSFAAGAPAQTVDADKAGIESERAAAEARYAGRERECRERFVVTSCIENAQRERRTTLNALRARQQKIDEARRRARAAERRAEIAARAAELTKRDEAVAREPRTPDAPREPREPRPQRQPPTRGEAKPPRDAGRAPRIGPIENPADRRAAEARSRARFESRQREAAEHRSSSLERTIKRMEEKPAAAPLPVPSASAIRAMRPASGS